MGQSIGYNLRITGTATNEYALSLLERLRASALQRSFDFVSPLLRYPCYDERPRSRPGAIELQDLFDLWVTFNDDLVDEVRKSNRLMARVAGQQRVC